MKGNFNFKEPKIPTITITGPKPIKDFSVPKDLSGGGNKFTNWTGSNTNSFGINNNSFLPNNVVPNVHDVSKGSFFTNPSSFLDNPSSFFTNPPNETLKSNNSFMGKISNKSFAGQLIKSLGETPLQKPTLQTQITSEKSSKQVSKIIPSKQIVPLKHKVFDQHKAPKEVDFSGVKGVGVNKYANKAVGDLIQMGKWHSETQCTDINVYTNMRTLNLENTGSVDEDVKQFILHMGNRNLDLVYLSFANNQISDLGFKSFCIHTQSLTYNKNLSVYNIQHINFSNNVIGDGGAKYLWLGLLQGEALPTLQSINLSNNQIGDKGAQYISNGLIANKRDSLKVIDVSGNNITETGHLHLIKAMEDNSFPDMAIVLKTIKKSHEVSTEGLKAAWDFLVKGLRYTVQEYAKNQVGTKWDINKVRSNQDIDKWQSCKDTVMNVEMGIIGGLIKCSTNPVYNKHPLTFFTCLAADGAMALANPDTLWCTMEIKDSIDEVDIMGDCNIF